MKNQFVFDYLASKNLPTSASLLKEELQKLQDYYQLLVRQEREELNKAVEDNVIEIFPLGASGFRDTYSSIAASKRFYRFGDKIFCVAVRGYDHTQVYAVVDNELYGPIYNIQNSAEYVFNSVKRSIYQGETNFCVIKTEKIKVYPITKLGNRGKKSLEKTGEKVTLEW